MGHSDRLNKIALDRIEKLKIGNPLKEYDVDSFCQGFKYFEDFLKWLEINQWQYSIKTKVYLNLRTGEKKLLNQLMDEFNAQN